MKTCFKCLCEKPLADFYKHSMMADGHLNKCKECTKSDVLKHRIENADRIRAYDRMRSSLPHRLEVNRTRSRRYSAENPEKRRAHTQLRRAVIAGAITPTPCLVCGAEKTEAHHPAYSLPLDVVWLCPPHHAQTHAEHTARVRRGEVQP